MSETKKIPLVLKFSSRAFTPFFMTVSKCHSFRGCTPLQNFSVTTVFARISQYSNCTNTTVHWTLQILSDLKGATCLNSFTTFCSATIKEVNNSWYVIRIAEQNTHLKFLWRRRCFGCIVKRLEGKMKKQWDLQNFLSRFNGGLGRLALFLLLLLFASARIFALTVICFSWKPCRARKN